MFIDSSYDMGIMGAHKLEVMYKVYDSYGKFLKNFPTYQQASNYKLAFGNYGWTIKNLDK